MEQLHFTCKKDQMKSFKNILDFAMENIKIDEINGHKLEKSLVLYYNPFTEELIQITDKSIKLLNKCKMGRYEYYCISIPRNKSKQNKISVAASTLKKIILDQMIKNQQNMPETVGCQNNSDDLESSNKSEPEETKSTENI